MPLEYLNALYNIAVERQKAEELQRQQEEKEAEKNSHQPRPPRLTQHQAMMLEDELEDLI